MWSNDATQNLLLAQSTLLQHCIHIQPRQDGGFYVSWLDAGHGFSLYLQRLDVNGSLMWDPAGKLVHPRLITSCTDYRLSVDMDGNAIIGIDSGKDLGPGGSALAFKVSPDGEMPWGKDGITLSAPDNNIGGVRCAATSDRGAAFFWDLYDGSRLHALKLDANGERAWEQDTEFATPAGNLRPAEVVTSDAGSVICAFVLQTNVSSLFTQKLASADGAGMWGDSPVTVVDATSATVTLPMRQDPSVLSDHAGGAIFGYPLMDTAGSERIRVQRIDTRGQPLYQANGLLATDTPRTETAPRFGFSAADERIYALWVSGLAGTGAEPDVRAQCIDVAGSLMWTGCGTILTPPLFNPATSPAAVEILPVTDGVMAAWMPQIGFPPQPLRVSLLDKQGQPVWQDGSVDVKASPTTLTGFPCGTIGATGYGAFAWSSDDNTSRAQNINMDGTLGVPTVGSPTLTSR
jgi:hypothetical protein